MSATATRCNHEPWSKTWRPTNRGDGCTAPSASTAWSPAPRATAARPPPARRYRLAPSLRAGGRSRHAHLFPARRPSGRRDGSPPRVGCAAAGYRRPGSTGDGSEPQHRRRGPGAVGRRAGERPAPRHDHRAAARHGAGVSDPARRWRQPIRSSTASRVTFRGRAAPGPPWCKPRIRTYRWASRRPHGSKDRALNTAAPPRHSGRRFGTAPTSARAEVPVECRTRSPGSRSAGPTEPTSIGRDPGTNERRRRPAQRDPPTPPLGNRAAASSDAGARRLEAGRPPSGPRPAGDPGADTGLNHRLIPAHELVTIRGGGADSSGRPTPRQRREAARIVNALGGEGPADAAHLNARSQSERGPFRANRRIRR